LTLAARGQICQRSVRDALEGSNATFWLRPGVCERQS